MTVAILGAVALAFWIYLLAGRGGFWLGRTARNPVPAAEIPARDVAVIVPARNEADVVGRAITSLLRQDIKGRLHVFLVDDGSTDGTAAEAARAAAGAGAADRVTSVNARPLPAGWTGKVWAQAEGRRAAQSFPADFIWLTDADIEHGRGVLAELIARAETGPYDLVSLMARLACDTWAERALIPAFVFFFFMLYPPKWVSQRGSGTAGAAGGCMLVRREALERIGGMEAIRGELIDDCALAREVKKDGAIWLGPAESTCSLRSYGGWRDIGAMIARTAFTQLRHSTLLLLATLVGMALTFLAPPLMLFAGGWATACGAAAWLLMSLSYWPMLRYYRRSPLWAPLLPLIACSYMGATVYSAILYRRGSGGRWKGRAQDLEVPTKP